MKSSLAHIALAGVLCAIAIIGFGFWYSVIETKSIEVANLESQIDTKTETSNRIASARASLAEIAGDEAIMQSYFVPETGVVAFITDLEALGRSQGATVSVLSVSKGGSSTQPMLIFSLTIKGTFDAVMRTVGAIEYSPYDLSTSMLFVGQDEKKNWRADLNLLVGSVSTKAATSTPKI